jgi:ribose/xylose/arabinose/galactoside ABC-type transport system permease subunit
MADAAPAKPSAGKPADATPARRGRRPSVPVRELPVVVLLVGMVIYFALKNDVFLHTLNLENIGKSYFAQLCLLTIASALVLLTRGIDLSVAATMALSAVLVGKFSVDMHVNIWLTCVIAMLAGTLAGLINGILIMYIPLSPIIATLSTLTLYRGIALGISNGDSYSGYPNSFDQLGTGKLFGIPLAVVIVLVILAIVLVVMHRTIFGRWVYALGGNAQAARLAGVPVTAATIATYALSGLISSIAGILAVAQLHSARADIGEGMELDAITAAILGGVSIAGGRGYVFSAALGALSLAVLRNGLTLVHESGFVQTIVIGCILLIAVLIDRVIGRVQTYRETRGQLHTS